MIADELISEIRDRTDIVALIGEYVELKQRGQNWVGLCPFHNEKSPSFNVRRDRQFFHCFGCKESGDALGFLMRLEGLTFPQAARALAEKLGIEIKEASGGEDDQRKRDRARIERLCALMETATTFYLEQRSRHALCRFAIDELAKREVDLGTADVFRLGYAPHGWDALTNHLQQKGHALADAELLGMCVKRRDGSGYYDRFRHRLVFPISDLQGNVVAFSGRILPSPDGKEPDKDKQEPKYVNSPESPLYKKGEILYGLYESRVEVRRTGWAVLCEGNFDLVSLHRGGVHNVVAPLGTAFTETQAKLLRRFAQRVTLMFDGDNAGRKAVHAAYPIVQKAELTARVVKLPQGDDPDAYLRRHGPAALSALIDSGTGIVEFLIDTAAEQAGTAAGERAAAIQGLGPVVAASGNPVEIELYIQRIAQRFGIDDQRAVREQLRKGVRGARAGSGAPGPRGTSGPAPAGPQAGQTRVPAAPQRVKVPPELEGRLVGALLDKPELFSTPLAGEVVELLTAEELRSIFSAAAAQVTQTGTINAPALVAALTGNSALNWLQERLSTETFADRAAAEQEVRAGLEVLARQKVIQHDLPKLRSEIEQAKQRGDMDLARELMKRHDELARARAKGLKR